MGLSDSINHVNWSTYYFLLLLVLFIWKYSSIGKYLFIKYFFCFFSYEYYWFINLYSRFISNMISEPYYLLISYYTFPYSMSKVIMMRKNIQPLSISLHYGLSGLIWAGVTYMIWYATIVILDIVILRIYLMLEIEFKNCLAAGNI